MLSNVFFAVVSSIAFSDIEVICFIRENLRNTENYKEMDITQVYHPETPVNPSVYFLSVFFFCEIFYVVQIALHNAISNLGLSKLSSMPLKTIALIFNVKFLTEIYLTCSEVHKSQVHHGTVNFYMCTTSDHLPD